MFCYECGKEIKDNMEFCPYCGINLKLANKNCDNNTSILQSESEKKDSKENVAREYYWKGINIATSEKKRAAIYLEKAAELGYPAAICAMGDNLAFGVYTVNDFRDIDYTPLHEDLKRAEDKYKEAYEKGDFLAKNHLLKMYLYSARGHYEENIFGYGLVQVEEFAREWLNGAKDNEERKYALSFLCDNFYEIIELDEVLPYIEELVTLDEKENYRLGELYLQGYDGIIDTIEPNLDLAEKYMILAKEAKSIYAHYKLYQIHLRTESLEQEDFECLRSTAQLYMAHAELFKRELAFAVADWFEICVKLNADDLGMFEDWYQQYEEAVECMDFYIKRMLKAPNKTLAEEETLISTLLLFISTFDENAISEFESEICCEAIESYIKMVNDIILASSLGAQVDYMDALWNGDNVIKKNREQIVSILKKASELRDIPFEEWQKIRYCILEFYAYHKYEFNEEVVQLINNIYDGNVEKELADYKSRLAEITDDSATEACQEFIKNVDEIEERVHTVHGIRYETKAEAEVAEQEIKQIENIYKEKNKTLTQKYVCLKQQTFTTESAKMFVIEKRDELLEHIDYLRNNAKVEEIKGIEISDIVVSIIQLLIGFWLFAKTGILWKILGGLFILSAPYSLYEKYTESQNNKKNAELMADKCQKELKEFNSFFEIVDKEIVLKKEHFE